MIIKSGAWVEINLNNIEDNLKEIKNSLKRKYESMLCCKSQCIWLRINGSC